MLALPVRKFPLALGCHRIEEAFGLSHPFDHPYKVELFCQHVLRSFVRRLVQRPFPLVQTAAVDRKSSLADEPLEVASSLAESLPFSHVVLTDDYHFMNAVANRVPLVGRLHFARNHWFLLSCDGHGNARQFRSVIDSSERIVFQN